MHACMNERERERNTPRRKEGLDKSMGESMDESVDERASERVDAYLEIQENLSVETLYIFGVGMQHHEILS